MSGPKTLTGLQVASFYNGGPHPFLQLGGLQELIKTDAPILSDTSGYLNTVFGKKAWPQVNLEAIGFAMMPKADWDRSGLRLIEGLEVSDYTDMAMGETDVLPDEVKPAVTTITVTPRRQAKTFAISDIMVALNEVRSDDVFGSIEDLRKYRAQEFGRNLNKQIFHDVKAEAGAASGNYANNGTVMSIDRMISNDAEEDAYGGSYTGYYDYYDVDRDTATVYGDCVVSLNSDSNQELDDKLLRETIADAKEKGGKTSAMITGHDTYAQFQGIYQTFMRYQNFGEGKIQTGLNGIRTADGIDGGTPVAMVHGIPVLVSQDVTKDGVSRVYGVDISDAEGLGEPRMGMSLLRPIEYVEANNPIFLDKYQTKGAYSIVAENFTRFFPGQWKIMDLAA